MEAPVVDAAPAASGGHPDCPAWRSAATYGALGIDFEKISSPDTGFQLANLRGTISKYATTTPGGSSQLSLRPGHDDSSKQSLLGVFNGTGGGVVHLLWDGCLDVTSRKGISLFARGNAAENRVHLVPAIPVSVIDPPNLPVTEEWQRFSYVWADLCLPNAVEQGCPPPLAGISFYQSAADGTFDTWLDIDDVTFD